MQVSLLLVSFMAFFVQSAPFTPLHAVVGLSKVGDNPQVGRSTSRIPRVWIIYYIFINK